VRSSIRGEESEEVRSSIRGEGRGARGRMKISKRMRIVLGKVMLKMTAFFNLSF
jgi:hypothetical protein